MLTPLIVAIFILGYLCITLEDVIKVNKAAVALLMCVACWVSLHPRRRRICPDVLCQ